MNEQLKLLSTNLKNELDEIRKIIRPAEQFNATLKAIDQVVEKAKLIIDGNHFISNAEEIEFFKKIKPEIYGMRIFEGLKYNLILNKPIGTVEIRQKYLNENLKALQSFFRLNSFHYQYFKNDLSDLDEQYFLSASGPLSLPLTDIPDADDLLYTPMSFLFARFKAYEEMQYFISDQIAGLNTLQTDKPRVIDHQFDLKWTGDAVNLVELAYGLWLTGQLNNGNASLNQIVKWLEANFQVNIGIIQRRFSEIEARKRISVTKYIDQMRDNIRQKMEANSS